MLNAIILYIAFMFFEPTLLSTGPSATRLKTVPIIIFFLNGVDNSTQIMNVSHRSENHMKQSKTNIIEREHGDEILVRSQFNTRETLDNIE